MRDVRDLDHLGRPVVVVTGMGVVTSLGFGQEENWAALTSGRSGIKRITRFPTEGLRTTFGGTVDGLDVPHPSAPALSERLAELVIDEAVREARIGRPGDFPGPLFLSLPPVELEWTQRVALDAVPAAASGGYDGLLSAATAGGFEDLYARFMFGSVAEALSDRYGFKGAPISISTACASGGTAIQLAVEAIRRRECDAALCVGTDASLNPEALIRFSLLSALSTRNDDPAGASRPFAKDRDGFVMAEGAASLVLESRAYARARGARILGVVEGFGERADSFHRTRSSPDGRPIIASLHSALDDAGVAPDAVDAINAHGTGTPENDKMEWLGLSTVFGNRMPTVPVSANKSMIGHTLTAAGAIEAVFSLLTITHGRLPPTINYHLPDPAIPVDCVPNEARDMPVGRIVSNSFGFGGQNVCLVLAAEGAAR